MSNLDVRAPQDQPIGNNNGVLIQFLGLSPILAVSTSVVYGLSLGIATVVVLLLSCLTVSLLRRKISEDWRLLWFMLILAGYTTIIEILMQQFYFPLFIKLGIYVPLICCNAAILMRMETCAFRSNLSATALDALKTGAAYLIAILLLAAIRELIINGRLLMNWDLLIATTTSRSNDLIAGSANQLADFASTQAGALILLGLLIALVNFLTNSLKTGKNQRQEVITPVKRARLSSS